MKGRSSVVFPYDHTVFLETQAWFYLYERAEEHSRRCKLSDAVRLFISLSVHSTLPSVMNTMQRR
jgi:hypothetical protein